MNQSIQQTSEVNREQILEVVKKNLRQAYQKTKDEWPIGAEIFCRRGKGMAKFEVVRYITEINSITDAYTVIGLSQKGKEQNIDTRKAEQ